MVPEHQSIERIQPEDGSGWLEQVELGGHHGKAQKEINGNAQEEEAEKGGNECQRD